MNIGFIGLGNMGRGIAENLLKAGHSLAVYNRTRARAEALASLGARIADTPGDCSRGEVVFTMLADDAARERDLQQRRTQFTGALENMKILAEGGTLPPAPPAPARGGAAPAPGR